MYIRFVLLQLFDVVVGRNQHLVVVEHLNHALCDGQKSMQRFLKGGETAFEPFD